MARTQWKTYVQFNDSDKPKLEAYADKWIENAEKELSTALNKPIKFRKYEYMLWGSIRKIKWCLSLFELYPDPKDHQLLLVTNCNSELLCEIYFPSISDRYSSQFQHIITTPDEPDSFQVDNESIRVMPLIVTSYFNEYEIETFDNIINFAKAETHYRDLNYDWKEINSPIYKIKLNKAKSYMSVVTNESDFKKSIRSAVSSKSYSLASLLGVTKDILNYLDDDYESLQIEYLISGKGSDLANLYSVANKLVAIRTGLNLVFMFTSSRCQADAKAIATAMVGWLLIPGLVKTVETIILIIWAIAESVADVKTLLAGGKVPLIKSDGDLQISLSSAASGGSGGSGSSSGLKYEDYLRGSKKFYYI